MCKKNICLKNGIIFKSIKDSTLFLNINEVNYYFILKGKSNEIFQGEVIDLLAAKKIIDFNKKCTLVDFLLFLNKKDILELKNIN